MAINEMNQYQIHYHLPLLPEAELTKLISIGNYGETEDFLVKLLGSFLF